MADSADLRSEGKLSEDSLDVKRRKKYHLLKSSGICVTRGCGAPVKGRSYCYKCSSLQCRRTYITGLRFMAREAGINVETGHSVMERALSKIDFRRLDLDEAQLLNQLSDLLKSAEPLSKKMNLF